MEEKPISTRQNDFEKFSNKTSNMPMVVYWLTFALSLIFVASFWFLGFNTANALEEKQQEKDQIVALLSSPDIVEVEQEATNFKSAVTNLSTASASRVKKAQLLSDLFKNFTKDISISTLSISADGEMSMDGVAPSYKSVGEFMLALGENDRVSDVSLGSVSLLTSESPESGENVSFSLSSMLEMTKDSEGGEDE